MDTGRKLILGTVQFGLDYGINNPNGRPSNDEIHNILDMAFLNGISLLDTAEAYGDSQDKIGEYHRASSNRFEVITKFSPLRGDLPVQIENRILKNLQTLGVDFLYGYMFHSYNDYKRNYPFFKDRLLKLQKEGKVKKIGVSLYENFELEKVLGDDGIDLIQIPFNLLDNHSKRGEILKLAKDKGLEIHTRSVFLQGLFFKNDNSLTGNLKKLKPYIKEIRKIAKTNSISVSNLALNYVIDRKYIDNVLIGVDNANQLEQNLKLISKERSNILFGKINSIHVKEIDLLNPSKWKI